MSLDGFWKVIEQQISELKTATTSEDVIRILANERDPYGNGGGGTDAFFAGSGGDESVLMALREAGWRLMAGGDQYHYTMKAPNGDKIEYCEGDIYQLSVDCDQCDDGLVDQHEENVPPVACDVCAGTGKVKTNTRSRA